MPKCIRKFMSDVLASFVGEFKLVTHDMGLILFFLFLPLGYPVIYSLIYNPELVRDVPVVVVDHDCTATSRDMVRKLDATQEIWIRGYAADLNEARHAMDSHECYGILEIPNGFERKVGIGEVANSVFYCEMSLMLRYRGFLMAATNVMMEMGAELQTEKIDAVAPLAGTLMQGDILPIENVSLGNIRNGFDTFIMPGVLVLILHQCIILASGMSGGARRERPWLRSSMVRERIPGVLPSMLGQMLCFSVIIMVPVIFMMHYVPLFFEFPIMGDLGEELLFLLPMCLACMGVGFVLQGCISEQESVFVVWVVTSVVFLFLSGLTWPRYAMPGFWKAIGDIIPATWGVEGFIKMNTNGATLPQVRPSYINLWLLSAGWLVAGYCVQRWLQRPAELKTLKPCQRP